jgi:hypothetical protein
MQEEDIEALMQKTSVDVKKAVPKGKEVPCLCVCERESD